MGHDDIAWTKIYMIYELVHGFGLYMIAILDF